MFEVKFLQIEYCEIISNAFRHIGWNKPVELFQQYHSEQSQGLRHCFVSLVNDDFTGYCTIVRQSKYENFAIQHIVEISDLNVLPLHQNCGIGTQLIQECEKYAKEVLKMDKIGLGVGLTSDYSNALNLYIKLGYQFDELGIAYSGKTLKYGETITIDDELNLYLTKKL